MVHCSRLYGQRKTNAVITGEHDLAAMPAWLEEKTGHLVLVLHVQPGARRTEVVGTHGQALKMKLAAPPVDGKANDELLRYLADAFGVPLRNVALLSGATGRSKRVRIDAPERRPDKDWG